ncbi:cysteine and histidine-rich domain-containing protein 1-like [Saccoglossus kowalevskii]|uniref:Cysteine and histidine-rich domain-containing protein 1-like n=1 Tax=Saccoglossus kowalevskii TaxID=10224 RepID=A0ABM0GMZ5_SACKO|nr:PREDICTED: cysteine and histidine-rich domain-containing protein 1-like [Saccoglossus kowalevskii]
MSTAPLLQCYNKGCGQKFSPDENEANVCQHHPGVPVFHDAYKGWSCCKKRTTDFTEFLHIPGCTKGPHNNVKPPKPETTTPEAKMKNNEEIKVVVQKPLEPMQRPIVDEPRKKLPMTVSQSLKVALEREKAQSNEIEQDVGEVGTAAVKVGTICKNGGCGQPYQDESSNFNSCVHHPGVPVFHEGMKYWSCCQRKTSDFDNFLQQAGCSNGKHLWIKKDFKKTLCRYDWHQTGNFVFISVFAKVACPQLTYVEANQTSVFISIVFGKEENHFQEEIELYGVIDPKQSTVTMLGTKVEVKLRKSEVVSWKQINHKPENNKN